MRTAICYVQNNWWINQRYLECPRTRCLNRVSFVEWLHPLQLIFCTFIPLPVDFIICIHNFRWILFSSNLSIPLGQWSVAKRMNYCNDCRRWTEGQYASQSVYITRWCFIISLKSINFIRQAYHIKYFLLKLSTTKIPWQDARPLLLPLIAIIFRLYDEGLIFQSRLEFFLSLL